MSNELKLTYTFDIESWTESFRLRNIAFTESEDKKYSLYDTETLEWILSELYKNKISAIFFVTGIFAKKNVHLIKKISQNGHVVGSHSYFHNLIYNLETKDIFNELNDSKNILEDIISKKIVDFRAPKWSIPYSEYKRNKFIDILKDCNYQNDWSYNEFYHINKINYEKYLNQLKQVNLKSYAIKHTKIFGLNIPYPGGLFFRVYPFFLLKKILLSKKGILYLHPYDLHKNPSYSVNSNFKVKIFRSIGIKRSRSRFSYILKIINE